MADEEVVKQEELPLADKPADEPVIEAKADETPPEVAAEETPAEAKPEPVEERKPDDWMPKELKAKHRQVQDLKRQVAEEKAAREAAEALAAKFNQTPANNVTSSVPVDEVEKRAQQLVQQQRYIEDCNKAAQAGEKSFGADWKSAIENLELKGGFDEQTMRGILATAKKHGSDAPAKVLYELGKDPNRYDALMALPYEERIIEMADLVRTAPSKPVSNAPAPVSTVGGKATPVGKTLSDGLDDDQWFAIRRAQRLKKFKDSHI